jgi:competence protein ComEC
MAEWGDSVKRLWHGQGRRLALWLPVVVAIGIALRFEGYILLAGGIVLCSAMFCAFALLRPYVIGFIIALLCGIAAAEIRLGAVDAPILQQAWSGDVSGRAVIVDRSASGAPRITLDSLHMDRISDLPERVRISLRKGMAVPRVGDRLVVPAVLDAPRGPAEPGGFDFSRRAYFDRLGGVGYAVGDMRIERVPAGRLALPLRVDRTRGQIAGWLRNRIAGPEGAVAAALVVGDRSGIPAETRDALRDSGLAHLLAISGLHMGLLATLVYWVARLALALPPRLSERVAIRKIAAICALVAAVAYLVMSGASVATQRAFVMAAVAFLAITLDRAAVTMRGLAVAAFVILMLRPESMVDAGFQMSFAAAAALVAGYDATRAFWRRRAERRGWVSRLWTGVMATVMTSTLAGLATAPFAAYHFNRLVLWGLPANLLATPLMGLWIMPCILLTALLAPFGLAGGALVMLGAGIGIILEIAAYFASGDTALQGVRAGSGGVIVIIVAGGLWLVIWRGWLRLAGLLPVMIGLIAWAEPARPDLFIAADAALIAGRGESGQLWVSRSRAQTYSAEYWLRRDGEARPDRAAAYRRREWSCTRRRCRGWTGQDWRVVFLREGPMKRADCGDRTIVIAPHLTLPDAKPCFAIDSRTFDGASALTVYFPGSGFPAVRRASEWGGQERTRLWPSAR